MWSLGCVSIWGRVVRLPVRSRERAEYARLKVSGGVKVCHVRGDGHSRLTERRCHSTIAESRSRQKPPPCRRGGGGGGVLLRPRCGEARWRLVGKGKLKLGEVAAIPAAVLSILRGRDRFSSKMFAKTFPIYLQERELLGGGRGFWLVNLLRFSRAKQNHTRKEQMRRPHSPLASTAATANSGQSSACAAPASDDRWATAGGCAFA